MSLRGQLTALFAALAIPLLLLQAWWSYHDYRGAREDAWDDALAFAEATELGVRQFMLQSRELLEATVRQSGPGWVGAGGCGDEMRAIRETLTFLSNVLVVRMDGTIACSAIAAAEGASAVDWPWFEDFTRDGRYLVSPPVDGDFTRSWILPLVTPIATEEGEVTGALVGTVSLNELSRLLGGIAPPDEHLTSITTADGIVIARSHDPERWIGQSIPPPTGSDRLVSPGRWVAEGPDLTGIDRTWGQVRSSASGWMIYVGVPDELVYGPALREALVHVGATLFFVLIAVFVAARSYARIAGSLKNLAAKTRATASGEIVPLPADTPTEITEVVEQFNQTLRARDRAEAAERRARERFQSLFDNAVFGLYVSTADGRFLQANPALAAMLRYDSVEALLAAGPRALYPDPGQRETLIRASLERGHVDSHEIDWLRADGVPITVRMAGKMIDGPEGELVFEMIVQDITEEKRTEDELRQTQKMEAIGQLAGGIAHDFNNLLTVIGGNVELLEEDLPPDDALRADLNQIAKATQRATSLTRRLLTFSRRERRGEQVLDVNEVVPELRKMLVPLIGENVALVTELGPGPLPISIDPGELEQVVLNLVLNARDAMPRGGRVVIGTVAAPGGEADPDHARSSSVPGVILSVADDGVGMDAATRPRIFEPFYTTKPMGEGTGLGLSTVYGIVRRSGGTITVDSEPGEGTIIQVWFPLAEARAVTEEEVVQPAAAEGVERLLVVEDDELVRDFVHRALVEAGYRVTVAESGDRALGILRAEDPPFDLVLTDVVMPGLSGPELAERLAEEARDTPILFMSGYVDNSFLSVELETQPERLLRKPFSAVELRRRIREALDRNALDREAPASSVS